MVAGCGNGGGKNADDGRLDVVASFYPLAEVAELVGGEHVRVRNLTSPGVEPHDLELTTDQLDLVLDAEVVLAMGGRFQPAIDDAVRRRDGGGVVQVLPSLDATGDDPHVWLDPVLMQDVVDLVAEALAEEDPAHAEVFRQRAGQERARLALLDQEWRDGLRACRSRVLVTAHAAFGRLAGRYGLRQASVAGIEPDQEPDPRRLGELADLVAREGVTTIFTEPLVSPRVSQALARETGASVAVLDPVESLSDAALDAGDDYERVMRRNLAAVRAGLGCG